MSQSIVRACTRVLALVALAAFALVAAPALAQAQKGPAAQAAAFDASACLACHAPVKRFYDSGKHMTVGCNNCHDGTAAHLAKALQMAGSAAFAAGEYGPRRATPAASPAAASERLARTAELAAAIARAEPITPGSAAQAGAR